MEKKISFIKNSFVFYFIILPTIARGNCKCYIFFSQNYTKYYEYYSTETSTCPYTIHYITASNEKEAKNIFTDFIEDVYNNENVTGKSNISINLFTDYYDNETSGDYFKSITKQNNKLLYIKCEKKYREKALSIKKETGFYYQTRWTNVFLFIIPIITNSIHESLKMKNNKKQV